MDFLTDYSQFRRGPSFVRLLNVAPGIWPLDIYSDANLLEHPLSYGELTGYRDLPPGSHIIRAYIEGQTSGALENREIMLSPGESYTLAIGDLEKTGLFVVHEPDVSPPHGKTLIRTVHLSPKVDAIDIILPWGTRLFKNVKYENITDYVAVEPGIYTLFVNKSFTDKLIYKAKDICLEPDGVYTIYATGLLNDKPKFKLILAQDGDPTEY